MEEIEDKIRNHLQEMGYSVLERPYRVSTGEHYIIGFKENQNRDGFSATFVAQSTESDSRPSMEFVISGTQMEEQNLRGASCLNRGLAQFKEYVDSLGML